MSNDKGVAGQVCTLHAGSRPYLGEGCEVQEKTAGLAPGEFLVSLPEATRAGEQPSESSGMRCCCCAEAETRGPRPRLAAAAVRALSGAWRPSAKPAALLGGRPWSGSSCPELRNRRFTHGQRMPAVPAWGATKASEESKARTGTQAKPHEGFGPAHCPPPPLLLAPPRMPGASSPVSSFQGTATKPAQQRQKMAVLFPLLFTAKERSKHLGKQPSAPPTNISGTLC